MDKPFDIPGINNKLEALAKYLGINSDIETELSAIEQRHTSTPAHRYVDIYKHNEVMYFVATISYGLAADKVVEFNSNHWSILVQKQDAPYLRFYDAKVMTQLRSTSPDGYKLLAINQKEHKVLFRTQGGFLVVFSFASHVPENISTYYLRGSLTDGISDISKTFTNNYMKQNSDKMLHDQSFEVIQLPTEHQKTITVKFAQWYAHRSNSCYAPGNIRKASIICWAQANKIDVSEDDVDYIIKNYQQHIEVVIA